jgi:hypothetical protein
LIIQHRAAVLAIAGALMIYRTLGAAMIDTIISTAKPSSWALAEIPKEAVPVLGSARSPTLANC